MRHLNQRFFIRSHEVTPRTVMNKNSCELARYGRWNNGKSPCASISPGTYKCVKIWCRSRNNAVRRVSKTMAEPEARQILGVTEASSWQDVLQKYDTLFERNAKTGSFYLQSKVHKAKECLQALYEGKGPGPAAG